MYTYLRRFHWTIISGRFLMRDERITDNRHARMDGQVCLNHARNGEMLLLGRDVECFSRVIHRSG
jgi:hypothetical protein